MVASHRNYIIYFIIVKQAMIENSLDTWRSPYRSKILKITEMYGLEYADVGTAMELIKDHHREKLMKDVVSMKSLMNYSIRGEPWLMPGHVNDSKQSETIAKFRTGSAGLGNRTPFQGFQSKVCRLCDELGPKKPLTETHVMFDCKFLRNTQKKEGLLTYRCESCLLV